MAAMTNKDGENSNIAPFPSREERESLQKAHFVRERDKLPSEPILNLPPVVQALCLINFGLFLVTTYLPQLMDDDMLYALSFVPARYTGNQPLDGGALFSPFTHMFLHAGWLHISVNLGMLMAFGTGIEQKLGARRFILFYAATGLIGALIHAFFYPDSTSAMIGASGAISGLFGGVLMLMQEQGFVGRGYNRLLPMVLVWIGVSVFFGLFGMPGVDSPIAWTTHIGGFIAGMLLYKPFCRLRF